MGQGKRSLELIILFCMVGVIFGCSSNPSSTVVSSEESKKSESKEVRQIKVDYKQAALANVELGLGYLTAGQVARAKGKLIHAVELAPKEAKVRAAMAYFLETVGDIKEAEKEYQKSLDYMQGAEVGAMHNNYGAFLCRQNRLKEADEEFQKALQDKYYLRTAEVYENAGLCALKWPDKERAREYFKTAVRRDEQRARSFLELADMSLREKNYDESNRYLSGFRKVSEVNPRSLWIGIQVSQALKDENGIASQVLMLKNLFRDSEEYSLYQRSALLQENR